MLRRGKKLLRGSKYSEKRVKTELGVNTVF